jgi:hypothetical protein
MATQRMQDLEDIVWNRVGDRWLLGRIAAASLGISVVISTLTVAALIGVLLGWGVVFALPRPLLEIVCLLGVVSALILMSEMRRYWATLDNRAGAKHKVWFFFLRFVMFFGPALYFIFVYMPQVKRRWVGGVL